jgi:hypothetical protein
LAGVLCWCSESLGGMDRAVEAGAVMSRGVWRGLSSLLVSRAGLSGARIGWGGSRSRHGGTRVGVPDGRRWICRGRGRSRVRRRVRWPRYLLMRREGERREAGGQPGYRRAGRGLRPEDQVRRSPCRMCMADAERGSMLASAGRATAGRQPGDGRATRRRCRARLRLDPMRVRLQTQSKPPETSGCVFGHTARGDLWLEVANASRAAWQHDGE